MTIHPTLILQTTRPGKRWPVHRLNQPMYQGKLEPNRRKLRAGLCAARIGEPRAKTGTPWFPVESKASPLLVILHYLLKNNTPFMGGYGAGQVVPPVSFNYFRLRGGN